MVKFCPHDLFVNTRADLGACPKVHCEEAKTQYNEATNRSKMQYEDEFVAFAMSLLNDVERRIEKGKQRLELMNKTETVSILKLFYYYIGNITLFVCKFLNNIINNIFTVIVYNLYNKRYKNESNNFIWP